MYLPTYTSLTFQHYKSEKHREEREIVECPEEEEEECYQVLAGYGISRQVPSPFHNPQLTARHVNPSSTV
jgi:hypothetical protein